MTDRLAYYLNVMAQSDTITKSIMVVVGGLMGLWYVMRVSPIKMIRRLSGFPFWTFITILFVTILFGLLYLQYGGRG